MLITIHGVMLDAHCNSWSDAFSHCYTWSLALCSFIYME